MLYEVKHQNKMESFVCIKLFNGSFKISMSILLGYDPCFFINICDLCKSNTAISFL